VEGREVLLLPPEARGVLEARGVPREAGGHVEEREELVLPPEARGMKEARGVKEARSLLTAFSAIRRTDFASDFPLTDAPGRTGLLSALVGRFAMCFQPLGGVLEGEKRGEEETREEGRRGDKRRGGGGAEEERKRREKERRKRERRGEEWRGGWRLETKPVERDAYV